MNSSKRGYILVEVLIVIAIVLLLGGITITMSIQSIEDYFINIDRCYFEDKFDNALLNIDSICNSNGIVSIESNVKFTEKITKDIKGNNIVVTFKNENQKEKIKIIHLNDEKLMLRTLNYETSIVTVGNNVILDDVNSFEVIKKENLVYYSIKTKKSGIRIRCI